MRSYPKLRKTIKWGGAAMTLVLIVVWAASLRWQVSWTTNREPVVMTCLSAGEFAFHYAESVPCSNIERGWNLEDSPGALEWNPYFERSPGELVIVVTILLPAAFTLSASLIAWRLDVVARRRALLHLCTECSYNLAGLPPAGPCPECGNAAHAPTLPTKV